ncbi:hypothetical protein [Ramlibacter sp.]|uniref:hypothetical protein n=1 Tax=Ramlibacter sp. TaxID=1917967 RepID=UPI002C328DD2|nr:hypothetical protein [Ramlibacter sp.]HWI84465.1 hypothetical protein [Ramlibacter sp.]
MGSTLQAGPRHSATVDVSRDRSFEVGDPALVNAAPLPVGDIGMARREPPPKQLAGKPAKAGRS